MDERKAAVAYARTDHGELQSSWQEVARQHEVNQESTKRLGVKVVALFFDQGTSSDTADRPGLSDLLDYVAANPVDLTIVSKIDRPDDVDEQRIRLLARLKLLGVDVLMADSDAVVELIMPADFDPAHVTPPDAGGSR